MGNCRSKERQADVMTNNPQNNLCGDTNIVYEQQQTRATIINSLGSANCSRSGTNNNNNDMSHKQNSNKSSNENVIDSTKAEVNDLLERISQFEGTTESDKNYRYLDEMLTRCILKLDNIQYDTSQDRSLRKEAIQGVNQAISLLERKLEINSDIKQIGKDLEGN